MIYSIAIFIKELIIYNKGIVFQGVLPRNSNESTSKFTVYKYCI